MQLSCHFEIIAFQCLSRNSIFLCTSHPPPHTLIWTESGHVVPRGSHGVLNLSDVRPRKISIFIVSEDWTNREVTKFTVTVCEIFWNSPPCSIIVLLLFPVCSSGLWSEAVSHLVDTLQSCTMIIPHQKALVCCKIAAIVGIQMQPGSPCQVGNLHLGVFFVFVFFLLIFLCWNPTAYMCHHLLFRSLQNF